VLHICNPLQTPDTPPPKKSMQCRLKRYVLNYL
jgi:hypothetical protein